MQYTRMKWFLCITTLIVLSGCASLRTRVNGADFQEGVKASTAEISSLYSSLNGVEADVVLLGYASDLCDNGCGGTCPIKDNPKARCACRCKHLIGKNLNKKQFSVESVKARLSAMKVLNTYAKGIAEISSTDSPQVANENLQALGSQVKDLSGTFDKLGTDLHAAKYIEPLSALAGIILEARLESKRKKTMSKAVNTAGPIVTKITDLLREDLTIIIDANKTAYAETQADLVSYYNHHSAKMSFSERQALLEKIRDVGTRMETANGLASHDFLEGIIAANNALMTFANSEQKVADIEKVNAALKEFNQ